MRQQAHTLRRFVWHYGPGCRMEWHSNPIRNDQKKIADGSGASAKRGDLSNARSIPELSDSGHVRGSGFALRTALWRATDFRAEPHADRQSADQSLRRLRLWHSPAALAATAAMAAASATATVAAADSAIAGTGPGNLRTTGNLRAAQSVPAESVPAESVPAKPVPAQSVPAKPAGA